ncbi:MAG: hypothetical protein ACYTKD_06735 [Planctomycetota bacterium]|jgi:hypothetical protein
MAEADGGAEASKKLDTILMRVFYIEAIIFMAGVTALGIYVYPTITRLMDLSLKLGKIGDIGALVDDQIARVEGKLKGVTDRVSGRVDELGGKLEGVSGRLSGQLDDVDKRISGVTSRLDGQVTDVEKRLDNMFKGLEERLRDLFKLKFGGVGPGRTGDTPEPTAAASAR